eukprot:300343-Prorocentrum_lima.AAC.1
MTSSLVGSEMCIRDSLWKTTPRRHFVHVVPISCDARRQQGKQKAPATTCLLYTSDAADDM